MMDAHRKLAPVVISILLLGGCHSPLTQSSLETPFASQVSTGGEGILAITPDVKSNPPLALIYKGLGSCSKDQEDAGQSGYGCSEASADAASLAGFQFRYVGPEDLSDDATQEQVKELFGAAKVWIQPGGVSNVAYGAMTQMLKTSLVEFVQNGGGFVGFCAGAFLATDWFHLLDASSGAYSYQSERPDVGFAFLDVLWSGHKRSIYFEGGPYFYNVGPSVDVTARFLSGDAESARAPFGKGRVYITGGHPEAPAIWSEEDDLHDPDGSDLDLAAEMITWASGTR
jgi:hypothetical protein